MQVKLFIHWNIQLQFQISWCGKLVCVNERMDTGHTGPRVHLSGIAQGDLENELHTGAHDTHTHTHTFIYFFYILPQLLFDFTLPDYQLLKVAAWVNKQMSWSQIKWSNCWGVDRELEWSSKFGVRHYLLCVTTARVRMRSWEPASLIVNSSWCVKGLALAVV